MDGLQLLILEVEHIYGSIVFPSDAQIKKSSSLAAQIKNVYVHLSQLRIV